MNKNEMLFEQANKYMSGGVNSPVRAFNSVDSKPLIIEKAKGSKIYDADDNEYLDFVMSWGPLILGHANEEINNEIISALGKGLSYGVTSEIEVKMANIIVDAYPGIEKVRMVNSGTEATMSALRLAKGYTNRDKIVKFEGGYHGHSDALLVKSGSGTLTFNMPTSPGISENTIKDTLVAKYNDIESVKQLIVENKDEIAAVIIEPVAGNMGLIPGELQFLKELREVTKENGIVLIFDEVISGFRVCYGGVANMIDITPDIVCFGKIIGAGLPAAAYAGPSEIMDKLAPIGDVYQAGTLSGNPLVMHAGIKQLEILRDNPEIYDNINEKGAMLAKGLTDNINKLGIDANVVNHGSLVTLFFQKDRPYSFDDLTNVNTTLYAAYHKAMLDQGILLPPSQYEAMFISNAHTTEDIERTIKANFVALQQITK